MQAEINKVAGKGLDLPQIPHITVEQPMIMWKPRVVQVCANLMYHA